MSVWICADRLSIEYQQTKLARYRCVLDRKQKSLTAVSHPQFYSTPFASPQLEFFELDDEEWLKVRPHPPYSRSKPQRSLVRQYPLGLELNANARSPIRADEATDEFPAGLTAREVEVLQLIAQGTTNR